MNCVTIPGIAQTAPLEAFDCETIVNRYYAMLYRFALGPTRNIPDACDLTQETFVVWATKGHLLRDKTKVKAWLFTTLHRQFLCQCRHESRWQRQDTFEAEYEAPHPMPEAIDRLEPGHLMDCLLSLNEIFRVPLILFYLQNQSYKEIVDVLAVPIRTVMSRLSRGKQNLQKAVLYRQNLEQNRGLTLIGAGSR